MEKQYEKLKKLEEEIWRQVYQKIDEHVYRAIENNIKLQEYGETTLDTTE